MAGKAQLPKTGVDRIVKDDVERKKQFGRERSLFAGIPQILAVNGVGVSQKASGGIVSQSMSLPTSGGPMIGPIAFHPVATQIDAGVIDIGTTGNAFSSRVIVLGAGGSADNLCRVSGSAHAGQILFVQAVSTTAITLKHETDEGAAVGNIYIPSGADYTIAGKEIVLLQWDTINQAQDESTEYGQWTLIGSSAGNLLSSTNTWTGGNTWTGSVGFAGASTSITSPNIYIGDATSDTVNILGNISSTGVNTWTGINTFASPTSFSVTSPNIYIGDEATDTINITGTASHQGDIDMNTWDIFAVDRVKFSQTEGSGDALASTDTGIEAIYTSTLPFGMKIQIPTANSAIFQIVRGSTEMLNISALGLLIGDDMSMSDNKITNLGDPTADSDAATKEYVDDNAGGSGANTSLSNLSSVSVNTGFDMNNNNITDCGQVDCTAITDTGVLMVDGSTYLNGAVNLGNSSGDDIDLEGQLDVRSNYTSSTVAFSGLYAVGYVTIKVAGSTKWLYYGAG